MALQLIDWLIVAAFFAVILLVGVLVSKRAGSSSAEYFLGGRSMPWWLLGVSMVATTLWTVATRPSSTSARVILR